MLLSLQAISKRYPDIYEERMRSKLLNCLEHLDEEQLSNIFRLLGADPQSWHWLDESTKVRLRRMTQLRIKVSNIDNFVFEAIAVNDLRLIIVEEFEELSSKRQLSIIESTPQLEFSNRAISL